ncbi:MAG: 50S ribosomal protein L17 [Deltaproteobacteria bacterium]|jgi:large subunit ribosomal protein L17|nr:50S ribosomal protein L17 [Deltaproteobacteria bacterium]
MRHRKRNIKLGRTASHRDAMLRNMAQSLLQHGRIKTTVAKGKAVKPVIDRLVTLAKRGPSDLHAIRQAAAILYKPEAVKKLFEDPVQRFGDRVSGYTQMARAGLRKGDAAPMCVLRLVTPDVKSRSRELREVARRDRSARVAASQAAEAKKTTLAKEPAAAAPEPAPEALAPEAPEAPAPEASEAPEPGAPDQGEGSSES